MKLLVIPDGSIIACGNYVETKTTFEYPDQIVPKVVVPKHTFVDIDVPEGFVHQNYTYVGGKLVKRPPDPEETTKE